MKELSVDQKASAYDEALEKAKEYHTRLINEDNPEWAGEIETIFPELKESEDEKMINFISNELRSLMSVEEVQGELSDKGIKLKDAIAWLEKQGEKPQGKTALEAINEERVDYVNKVEPKFKVGDWVINRTDATIMQIVNNKDFYESVEISGQIRRTDTYNYIERNFRLWIIQDAEDGDVLAVNNEVFIYAHRKRMYSIAVAHCFVDSAGGFYLDGEFGYIEKANSIHPATKEQRDQLEKAMADAGYTFDFEKKELKKIEQEELSDFEKSLKHIMEETLECGDTHNLKADAEILLGMVRKQVNPTWSEEDESILQGIWDEILANKHDAKECEWETYDKFLNWLESLRPKNRWKPSEEQMDALLFAEGFVRGHCAIEIAKELINLYNDLKKLREE